MAQDGLTGILNESSASQIAASARRIYPLAFGLPPFGSKGKRLNGQARRLIYAKLECPMQDIHL